MLHAPSNAQEVEKILQKAEELQFFLCVKSEQKITFFRGEVTSLLGGRSAMLSWFRLFFALTNSILAVGDVSYGIYVYYVRRMRCLIGFCRMLG